MADQVQSVDDLIMCLVGMGFEFEDCQLAVQVGKLNVQDAVEWILAGKPQAPSSSSGGGQAGSSTLKLDKTPAKPATVIGSNPFSNPQPITQNVSPTSASGPSDDTDITVISRSHMNEEQRKIKDRFEEKQRDEARRNAQEEKLAQKRARERAIKQIQEDRERQKLRKQSGEHTIGGKVGSPPGGDTPQGAATAASAAGGEEVKVEDKKCMIQVRLPTGRVLKESFISTAPLSDVWALVMKNYDQYQDKSLMQPFPRMEFTSADMAVSLHEHGLYPSGSLVLKKTENPQPAPADMDTSDPVSPDQPGSPPADADPEAIHPQNLPAPSLPPPHPPGAVGGGLGPGHVWGSGQALELEGQGAELNYAEQVEEAMEEVSEDEDIAGGGQVPGGPPPGMPGGGWGQLPGGPLPGGPGGPGGNWGGGWGGGPAPGQPWNMGNNWGLGQVLNAQWAGEENQQPHHAKNPKQLAADAANQRYAQKPDDLRAEEGRTTSSLHYNVPCLKAMIVNDISNRICDTRHPITSLQGLPAEVASYILQHLIKECLLRNKTLHPFISCHIKNLVLDSYPYVTNELLTAIRLHTSLVHLSIASCPLITDKGVLALSSLKKLKFLSLLGCKQLTDKCLALLKELPSLVTLVLEDTGVTDEGIIEYCVGLPNLLVSLKNLDLSRTRITSAILPHLKKIPHLKSLSLENTKLSSLSGLQEVMSLESLNIANTLVVTDSLLCVAGHPSLKRLNISNTQCVQGDRALQYLRGLQLQILQMPSRLTTTSLAVQCLSEMPLIELDLTNYVNIPESGFEPIGRIFSLKRLRLSNTKISDRGMVFLAGLRSLEELLLDRTAITDTGASVIQGPNFPDLQELSLSETLVSNKLMKSPTLNSCFHISKLNLSKTQISDKGVASLRLPYLSLLNLDGTRVRHAMAESLKESPSQVLRGCPRILRVTCNNTVPSLSDDEDDV